MLKNFIRNLRNSQNLISLFWAFTNTFSIQLLSFIITIVLARVLSPEDFGVIAMIAVFIAVGRELKDSGMTSSLIRSKDHNQIDLNVVYFSNLALSIFIYIIIYFSAPLVARFYEKEILISVLRLFALVIPIGTIGSIQSTLLTKEMKFKTKLRITVPSLIIGGVVAIILALNDFGVWSLVWMNIIQTSINSIQLWFYRRWMPTFDWDWKILKHHFNFGVNLTFSNLLNVVYKNIYSIIIGKFFSASILGFYDRANSLKQLPVNNVTSALTKVTYPVFARIQDENFKLKGYYKLIIQEIIFILMPILGIAAILAKPLFLIVLGEKWLPAVPYFQILTLVGLLYPINGYNLNILKVKGRTDIYFKLSMVKKVIELGLIFIGINFGIYGLLVSQITIAFLSLFINSYYSGKFIGYTLYEQFKDVKPIVFLNTVLLIIFFVFYHYKLNNLNDYLLLSLYPIIYVLIYTFFASYFKFEALQYLKTKFFNN